MVIVGEPVVGTEKKSCKNKNLEIVIIIVKMLKF